MVKTIVMTMKVRKVFRGDNYWPEAMDPERFYQPVDRGFEHKIRERLDYWERLRREIND